MALLLPATADAASVRLVATGKVQRWESRQAISDIAIEVTLRVRGRDYDGYWSGCRGTFLGSGVALRVTTCGDPARVHLRYVSLSGKRRFRVTFRGVGARH